MMLFSGCKDGGDEQGKGKSSSESKEVVIPSSRKKLATGKATRGWRPYKVNDAKVKWADVNFILHGVARKKFGNLDAMVKNFDKTYADGNTYRAEFYRKFSNYGDYNEVDSGAYHDQYITNLELWRDKHPEMGAPWIALAGFEVNRAWFLEVLGS